MEIDYSSHLYKKKHTLAQLISEIDSVLGSQDSRVRCFPCFCTPEFIQRLDASNDDGMVTAFANYSTNEVKLYQLVIRYQDGKEKRTAKGFFFLVEAPGYPGVYSCITLESAFFFERGILSLFRHRYPLATLTFVTHKKLQNLLLQFRDQNQFSKFIINRASIRARYEKRIVSSVSWPKLTLEAAFEWVSEQDGWFNRLTVEANKSLQPQTNISISRQGIISTNRMFSKVNQFFLEPLQKTVNENVQLFSQRSRRETKNLNVRPLAINLQYDQFSDVKENKRFIEQMQKMKSASVSVVHGNPYIHLSVFDYYDGSAFDIWVLSADRIIIVPQMKGTMQAIKRLVSHIFDNYAEGRIEEYSPNYDNE